MRVRLLTACAVIVTALAGASHAGGASLERVGSFNQPVYVTSLPDPNRLLVVEQPGRVLLVESGAASTFLDIRSMVASGGEQGLLSIAVAPDYATTGRVYVFYTRAGDGALQIDEYTASGNSAPQSSRRPVLTIPHPTYANHNGGQLQFGPDGYLYVGTGDGGAGGDPNENAQALGSRLGKILRIEPRPAAGEQYSVPPDNPFPASPVWSYGLRNPWRFSFDRLTGALLIADVGQAAWEEVDFDPAPRAGRGVDWGWDCREGRHYFELCLGGWTDPIFEYPNPGVAAITGGYVVRDTSLGDLYGRYLYADFYVGEIRSFVPALPNATGDRSEGISVSTLSSFGEDTCGRLYVASLGTGVVSRLIGSTAPACTSTTTPPTTPPPVGATCAGRQASAGPAADGRVVGTPESDVIVGHEGRDRVRAKGGNDLICAGPGKDRIRAGPGRDTIHGGPGEDRCHGGPGKDRKYSC